MDEPRRGSAVATFHKLVAAIIMVMVIILIAWLIINWSRFRGLFNSAWEGLAHLATPEGAREAGEAVASAGIGVVTGVTQGVVGGIADTVIAPLAELRQACPAGTALENGLCYPPCRPGFEPAGPVCWQPCPRGFRNDGAFCAKPPPYTVPAGTIPRLGPCPPGTTDDGTSCWSRTFPWTIRRTAFQRGRACPAGMRMDAGLCYQRCREGYHNVGALICSPNCPPGMTDIGVSCARGTHTRGAGIIPDLIGPEDSRHPNFAPRQTNETMVFFN